jgi:hypothetical protein
MLYPPSSALRHDARVGRLLRRAGALAFAVLIASGLLLAPGKAEAHPGLVYGINIAGISPWTMALAKIAGFTHVKATITWRQLQKSSKKFEWKEDENDLDNILRATRKAGLRLVLRVDGGPPWEGGEAANASPDAIYRLFSNLADEAGDTVAAYEILNEPNLASEWGAWPDGAAYAAFLRKAYEGVKAGNPRALVLGGGLAPAAEGAGGVNDFEFVRQMYRGGVKGALDALSVHNYGGGSEPERDPYDCNEVCFRRAERYKQLLVELGDPDLPIWATEFGWPIDGGRDLGQFNWMKVSPETQADYLVRAYRYAYANWDWMRGMLIFNLDHSTAPWHGKDTSLYWFSILNSDHSPRPAFHALAEMGKP